MKNKFTKLALGTAATAALGMTAHAQSSDALIDKLVDKGILTVSEAKDLREESDKDFKTAFSAKTGMPDWVTGYKISGDLRARYDGIYGQNPSMVDRNRFRYRLRFGVTADIINDLEVGFRLTSSEGSTGGDPISGNTTMADNGSKKLVFIDQVYAKWSPIHTVDWTGSFTFGKMENPFIFPSATVQGATLLFDKDYTPEGVAMQLGYNLNHQHSLKLIMAGFALDELKDSSLDPYFGGAQLRWDAKWSSKWSTTAGVAGFSLQNTKQLVAANDVQDINRGNSRDKNGTLLNGFTSIYVDAGVTYTLDSMALYPGAFPISVIGDYVHNCAVSTDNAGYSIGFALGKAGKKGTWELDYRWEELQRDAWYEEFTESDFGAYYQSAPTGGKKGYGSGTNLKGHWVKLSYSPYDSLTFGVSAFFSDLIKPNPGSSESATTRILADAVFKF